MNSKNDVLKSVSKMDWGLATLEFHNDITNAIVHVFNHWLQDPQSVDRAVRFAIGRIDWYNNYFMQSFIHEVVFDDVGQKVEKSTQEYISKRLMAYAKDVVFSSKRG